MAMTKKDFEGMAEAVCEARRNVRYSLTEGTATYAAAMAALDKVAEELATACHAAYRGGYGFNRARFMEACGVEES